MLFRLVNRSARVDLKLVIGAKKGYLLFKKLANSNNVVANFDLDDTKRLESLKDDSVLCFIGEEDIAVGRIVRSPLGVHVAFVSRIGGKRNGGTINASGDGRGAGRNFGSLYYNRAAMEVSIVRRTLAYAYDGTNANGQISKADGGVGGVVSNGERGVVVDHERPVFAWLVRRTDIRDRAVDGTANKRPHRRVFDIRLTIALDVVGIHLFDEFSFSAGKSAFASGFRHFCDDSILGSDLRNFRLFFNRFTRLCETFNVSLSCGVREESLEAAGAVVGAEGFALGSENASIFGINKKV